MVEWLAMVLGRARSRGGALLLACALAGCGAGTERASDDPASPEGEDVPAVEAGGASAADGGQTTGPAAVFAALAAMGPRVEAWIPIGLMPLVLMLTATPHYGATLVRVYEERETRRKYAVFSVGATLVLVALFLVSLTSPGRASVPAASSGIPPLRTRWRNRSRTPAWRSGCA